MYIIQLCRNRHHPVPTLIPGITSGVDNNIILFWRHSRVPGDKNKPITRNKITKN